MEWQYEPELYQEGHRTFGMELDPQTFFSGLRESDLMLPADESYALMKERLPTPLGRDLQRERILVILTRKNIRSTNITSNVGYTKYLVT